ncbi:MAG TPA: DNA polymerase IV [Actinomycetota bacterium]|nr:DNA polymerase IV [Actinomycetota bacterium]
MADIIHVDLDAFYVSVERGKDPALAGRPVIVGGAGRRGVVLSCSYEARERGVRNGMPSARAKRLCPDAVFVPPTFESYTSASRVFRSLLGEFTPTVEPISLDEAFCDVSGAHRLYGTTHDLAEQLRARVRHELGLVCSVGGGETKLVAKIASRAAKPDGVLVVDDPVAFLHPLPIEDLWGVGDVTAGVLRRLRITTIGELANTPESVLRRQVGTAAAAHLAAVAWGKDPSPVEPRSDARSTGAEETYESDIDADEAIEAELLRLSDRVASRLVDAGHRARTITVKIRLADYQTITRSCTLATPTSDVWTIFRTAAEAYNRFRRGRRSVRLLGVTASGFVTGGVTEQLTFERKAAFAQAEAAVEQVRGKFGKEAVRMARLLPKRDPV